MIFHPAVAYGIAFAVVALLAVFGVQNRRAGYRRDKYDLITENLELWQSMQQDEALTIAQSAPQKAAPVPVTQDQLAYHALQLTQLQVALASAGAPAVRPVPATAAGLTEKHDEARVS